MTELKKGRGPTVVLKGSCQLDIRRGLEELEALSFFIVGEECSRSKTGARGDGGSIATKLLASGWVDVSITDDSRLAAGVADGLCFVTALMTNPVIGEQCTLERYFIIPFAMGWENKKDALASTTPCPFFRSAGPAPLRSLFRGVCHCLSRQEAAVHCSFAKFYATANHRD